MTLEQAREKAQQIANETGSSVLVYQSQLHPEEYGTEFTLPTFGTRIGERIYPQLQEEEN